MRRLIYILPLLLFAVVAGYFALGLSRDPSVVPSALIDKPVPAFNLDGTVKDLAQPDQASVCFHEMAGASDRQ